MGVCRKSRVTRTLEWEELALREEERQAWKRIIRVRDVLRILP